MIKGTVILCLALVAVFCLRRRSAALRHRVLAAAIACAALVPFAEPWVPAWHVAVFQAPAAGPEQPRTLTDATIQAAPSAAAAPDARNTRFSRLVPGLRTIWGLGTGASLLLLAGGMARLMRIARRARPVGDDRWSAAAVDLARRCGIRRPLTILQTTHPTLLFTWGLRRPRVLLPAEAGDWSDERIRVVLSHELAHIRRGDWAVHLLAECVRAVYWFNPLAWIACDRLRLESEHACDDAVLRLGVAAPAYATELLDLARLFRRSHRALLPAPAMARSSDLERRIRIMLNPHLDRSPVGRVSGWFVVLTGIALTASLAGLTLTAASAAPADPAASLASTPAALAAPRPRAPEQQTGGPAGIAVIVTDQLDRTVPNVSVTLSSEATRTRAEGRTGRAGEFVAQGLVAGVYQVSVSKPGFKTARRTMTLEAGSDATARFVLELGSLQETVVVSAAGAPATTDPLPIPLQIGLRPVDDPCAGSYEGGCLLSPLKLIDAKPVYPAACIRAGTSGTVIVHARLRADGFTGDVQAEPGSNPALATAAVDAIRLWQYSPVHLDGVAFPVDMTVTVKFEIAGQL